MRYLTGSEKEVALKFIDEAAKVARSASCERSKCGSVIVRDNEIIGSGFNSPAGDHEGQRRCSNKKSDYDIKVADKTCCVHAEQRAMMDALKNNSDKLEGSRLYFIRLKEGEPSRAGEPYCTICSKMALDTGIKEFVLWKEKGVCVYNTDEYNDLSYEFNK